MIIRPLGDELFPADRRTDGHEEGNIPPSQFCQKKTLNELWNNANPSSGGQSTRRRLCL